MLEVLVVLYDCGDAVMIPVEGEVVLPHVVVRKSLDEVQSKHRWQATQSTKNTCFRIHSESLHILLLKINMKHVTLKQKACNKQGLLFTDTFPITTKESFPMIFQRIHFIYSAL